MAAGDPLDALLALEQLGIKFGLENIRTLVAALDHPDRAFQSIHVAGTNGKGSVTAMVDAALVAAGHHTGRYTSPHLIDLTERFAIDGRPVARRRLIETAGDVMRAVDGLVASGALDVRPTFFEATTAIAFELFRRAGVEVAVLEVGLGGRLDATNVVSPLATAITSIAFDHEQYLGRTLAAIAREKAGIIKRGVPVVVGRLDPEADAIVAAVAHDERAPIVRAWDGVTCEAVEAARAGFDPVRVRLRTRRHDYGEVTLALRGAHQVGNAVVAVRLLETVDELGVRVPSPAIVRALEDVVWPGRLDVRQLPDGREALLDAAHNPAGAAALAAYLTALPEPCPLVFSVMRDKNAGEMFRALLPAVSAIVLTRASTPRAADPLLLAEQARVVRADLPIVVEPAPMSAIEHAWRRSRRIVVAGSIFLLGDVLAALGGA